MPAYEYRHLFPLKAKREKKTSGKRKTTYPCHTCNTQSTMTMKMEMVKKKQRIFTETLSVWLKQNLTICFCVHSSMYSYLYIL